MSIEQKELSGSAAIQNWTLAKLQGAGLYGLVTITLADQGYLGEADTNATSFPPAGENIPGTDFGTMAVAVLADPQVRQIAYWCTEDSGVVDFKFKAW